MSEDTESGERPAYLDADNLTQTAQFIATAVASGLIGTYAQRIHDWLIAQFGLRGRAGVERLQDQLEQEVLAELKRLKRDPKVSDEDLELRVRELLRNVDFD